MYNHSVMTGVGGSSFAPSNTLTRGDFMLMLCRAFAFDSGSGSNFSDVAAGTYYYQAILTTKTLGIAQGSSNQFYPTQGITRQDGAVFLLRALNVAGVSLQAGSTSDLSQFSDVGKVQSYASSSLATLVRNGILVGDGSAINPEGIVSRAEMAVILHRVLQMTR
ncbi:Endo-1,4-beta-xylanase A [bioreactor metagenome]|uniref:Endo-1,4-beta-xylanase A n=1 Tax=bioreactor metagenome TaxID=1076179 RepID=A0A645I3X9_9ZZZZ